MFGIFAGRYCQPPPQGHPQVRPDKWPGGGRFQSQQTPSGELWQACHGYHHLFPPDYLCSNQRCSVKISKIDQFQTSLAASPGILHHTVWIEELGFSWLTQMKCDYTSNSHWHNITYLLKGWENVLLELGGERVKHTPASFKLSSKTKYKQKYSTTVSCMGSGLVFKKMNLHWVGSYGKTVWASFSWWEPGKTHAELIN